MAPPPAARTRHLLGHRRVLGRPLPRGASARRARRRGTRPEFHPTLSRGGGRRGDGRSEGPAVAAARRPRRTRRAPTALGGAPTPFKRGAAPRAPAVTATPDGAPASTRVSLGA